MKPMIRKPHYVWSDFPSLFEDFFGEVATQNRMAKVPAVNIKEKEDSFVLELAVPGFKKEDFTVNVEENRLMISSEHKESHEEKDGEYSRKEFSHYAFERSFQLPKDQVDIDKIDAKYNDGVLRVHLPKMKESISKSVKNILIGS